MLLLPNTPQIASQNNQISPRKALSQTTKLHASFVTAKVVLLQQHLQIEEGRKWG